MARFSAETLDLSRFPAPLAIRGVDYEVIMNERAERLVELFAEKGIIYTVEQLKSDPAIINAEADAFREMHMYHRVNDAVRSVMAAFSTGSDLEHMAARFSIFRRVLPDGTPEGDSELRRRMLLAPEAFAAAGPAGAYEFHALNADTRVLNVDVWSPGPGKVLVALQARDGTAAAPDVVIDAVRAHLGRRDIKPLTDTVAVRSVTVKPFAVSLVAYVLPGPDQVMVKTAIENSVAAMLAARRLPARDIPRSALIAAASVGPVDKVDLLAPAMDVIAENGELAVCTGVTVQVLQHTG